VFDINRKNLPVTVILLIIGIALSFIPYFNDINLTNELVYSIFLPGLLFISVYHFSARVLKKHRFVIGFLSSLGFIFIFFFYCIIYICLSIFSTCFEKT